MALFPPIRQSIAISIQIWIEDQVPDNERTAVANKQATAIRHNEPIDPQETAVHNRLSIGRRRPWHCVWY